MWRKYFHCGVLYAVSLLFAFCAGLWLHEAADRAMKGILPGCGPRSLASDPIVQRGTLRCCAHHHGLRYAISRAALLRIATPAAVQAGSGWPCAGRVLARAPGGFGPVGRVLMGSAPGLRARVSAAGRSLTTLSPGGRSGDRKKGPGGPRVVEFSGPSPGGLWLTAQAPVGSAPDTSAPAGTASCSLSARAPAGTRAYVYRS